MIALSAAFIVAASCATPPSGMVCVDGGPAVIGTDGGAKEESPRHTVTVPTFYIDSKEVTVGDYERCEKLGACPRAKRPPYYRAFQKDDQPLVPTTWDMAHAFCVFVGKRLPSEAEWEKAARGGEEARTYPWGEDAPTCDRANFKGCEKTTQPPGKYAAGAYGVFDQAGNGFEWVKDWWSPCYEGCASSCGADCVGDDPRGPCGGASKCAGHKKRVLKGGSWYWPADLMRGSFRRGQAPQSGLHRLSFRCASDSPKLSSWPPAFTTTKREVLAAPTAPSVDELQKFRAVTEDTDIMSVPLCRRAGLARVDCRDPMSYISSNEALQTLWAPAIENIGGAHVGLGADQNYSFIAHAKSRWAWLFDYDPTVVRLHHVLFAVIKKSATRADFVRAFTDVEKKKTAAAIDAAYPAFSEEERTAVVDVFRQAQRKLWREYARQSKPSSWKSGFGWLQSDENYAYIRALVEQGRILAVKGNMLTDKALPSIAESARALGVPIRVYYPSNAEEQWKVLPAQYRKNVAAFPFDDDTVVLRTLVSRQYHSTSSKWHYIVHGGQHLQRWIQVPGYTSVWRFMEDRHRPGAFSFAASSAPASPSSSTTGDAASTTDANADGSNEGAVTTTTSVKEAARRKRGFPPEHLSYIGVKGAPSAP